MIRRLIQGWQDGRAARTPMPRRRLPGALLAVLVGVAATPARSQPSGASEREAQLLERIAELEDRVRQLEDEREEASEPEPGRDLARRVEALETAGAAGAPRWPARVRLSGSASTGYFHSAEDGFFPNGSFEVWDARLFLEADLGRDVRLAEQRVLRDVGLVFEWDLVRLGELDNGVGDLYVDLRGLADSGWMNLQAGRFQIPVGENYLRFGRGYADNPFVTNPVGGPWWWDEGLRLYGSSAEDRVGYVASVTDGETPFNEDWDSDPQATLKLFARPAEWLYLSASGLRAGRIGSTSADEPAMSALWIGESWPQAFGSGAGVESFDHGVAIPNGPLELEGVTLVEGDVVLTFRDWVRLWLAYGQVHIDSDGPSRYDRDLQNAFDLGLYPQGESRTVVLRHPGVVRTYCSIHESMSGTILVSPSPWYDVADASGAFEIRGVPPGRYRLQVWNERMPRSAQAVRVRAGETARAVLTLGDPEPIPAAPDPAGRP